MAEMSVWIKDVPWARVRAEGNLMRAHTFSGLSINEQIHLLWTSVSQDICREDLKKMIRNGNDVVETVAHRVCRRGRKQCTKTRISWGIARKNIHAHITNAK